METIQERTRRVPRIQGLTQRAQHYQKNPTAQNKEVIQKSVTDHYTNYNFTYNHKALSLNQLSQQTHIPMHTIIRMLLAKQQANSHLFSPEQITEQLRGLQSLQLTWALGDRSNIHEQLHTLLSAQGGQYKAFISGEVNKALKLMLESQKGLTDIIAGITGKQGTQINILNQQQGPQITENHITVDKAIQMIGEQGTGLALPNHEEALNMFEKHSDGTEPEVNARLSRDGAIDGPNLRHITNMQKSQKERDRDEKKGRKGKRREQEEGLDQESL